MGYNVLSGSVSSVSGFIGSGSFTGSFGGDGTNLENVTQFRLNANTNSNTNADITANYEVVDDASYETIGSPVTQSSGIFTFPTTGKYLVLHSWYLVARSSDLSCNVTGYVTQDNSSYDLVSIASQGTAGNSNGQAMNFFLVDVTDTSNVKVKFATSSFTNCEIAGYTDYTASGVMFIRIGDT